MDENLETDVADSPVVIDDDQDGGLFVESFTIEERIARYTRIQTITSVVTGGFAIITALFLAYVSWVQLALTESQAQLELAQLEPNITVESRFFESHPLAGLESLRIVVNGGDARITSINAEVYGSFLIPKEFAEKGCEVILTNYFEPSSTQYSLEASDLARQMVKDGWDQRGNVPTFLHSMTVLEVDYRDAAGELRQKRFIGFQNSDLLMLDLDRDDTEGVMARAIESEREGSAFVQLEAPRGKPDVWDVGYDLMEGSRKQFLERCPSLTEALDANVPG